MKKFMKPYTVLLCLLLFISSCSLQKRHYQRGYHIVLNKNKKNQKESIVNSLKQSDEPISQNDIEKREPEKVITASNDKTQFIDLSKHHIVFNKKRLSENCDDIVLKNGEEIRVKVLEINQTEIKYKRCDNLEGPIFTIDKSSVFFVKYSNGTKEIFNVVETKKNPIDKLPEENIKKKKYIHPLSVLSFFIALASIPIFGYVSIIGGAALALTAIIFALIGGGITRKNKEKWTNRHPFTVLGLIFGIIVLIVSIVFLALLI
jgi:hypothetical protein